VETAEQLACLKELGCDYGQGFYFSAPVGLKEAPALITRFAQRRSGSAHA
jgi:EAL domain-containing protein (putative c-di-GMP-specific phosphodiesterase class I)